MQILRARIPMPKRALLSAVLLSAAAVALAQAPRGFTRIYGAGDRDLPTPAHTAKAATDSAALQAVLGFVKASGVQGWQGMTAQGTLTLASGSASYPARLSVLGSQLYRLDVDRDEGKQSTVLHGAMPGVFLSATGKLGSISSDIGALGLFSYPRLLSSAYPTAKSILTTQGTVTVGGKPLFRVTADDPDNSGKGWVTEDLYFDPVTGLLAKSAALIHLSTADAALTMIETDYTDYRQVNGATLPHTIARSLNGQPSWTLALTQIDTQTPPAPSVFSY